MGTLIKSSNKAQFTVQVISYLSTDHYFAFSFTNMRETFALFRSYGMVLLHSDVNL